MISGSLFYDNFGTQLLTIITLKPNDTAARSNFTFDYRDELLGTIASLQVY